VLTELVLPPLANTSCTKTCWHAIFQEQKCIQHAITRNSHSLFWLAFLLIQQSGYTHALVHAIFTSQFSLPPPPTWLTLTLSAPHSRRPSPQYLQPSHLVRGLHLLKSNEKVIEALSALFSGINSNCSQSTGHCTCILTVAISKPYAEDWGLQKSRVRFITNRIYLSVLSGMPISTVNVHKSTPAQCRSWWLFCRGINNSLTLLESWHLPPSSLSLAGQAHESCPRDYSSLHSFSPLPPFFSPRSPTFH